MLQFENALARVLEHSLPLQRVEEVALWHSLGRVLAANVFSDMDMPPFNKAAVDGYACRRSDIAQNLTVTEVIAAGESAQLPILAGACSKIMTGAPVPHGADCILMVEEVVENSDGTIRFTGSDTKSNIAPQGEDIRKGALVLSAGICIAPSHMAMLAATGVTRVVVAQKPIVAVLVTGNELVEPRQLPVGSQIRNSNGHQLVGQIVRCGGLPNYVGIIDDSKEATRRAVENAFAASDMVILTGGVSMGDFDYVPEVLKNLGVEIVFKSIAVQPGKPTLFGRLKSKLVFGLPGNPVSSLFQFEMLVKPAIRKLMGASKPLDFSIKLPLATEYTRRRNDRLVLVPAFINENGEIEPVNYHGSAHIFALSQVNAVFFAPIGATHLKKGELVDVRQL